MSDDMLHARQPATSPHGTSLATPPAEQLAAAIAAFAAAGRAAPPREQRDLAAGVSATKPLEALSQPPPRPWHLLACEATEPAKLGADDLPMLLSLLARRPAPPPMEGWLAAALEPTLLRHI